jgi:hypothetical protein
LHFVLNSSISSAELPATSFVKGKSSGASGYAVSAGGGSVTISLSQTSGTFSVGEQLIINGLDFSRTIKSVTSYSTEDIKSVYQSTSVSGLPVNFRADCLLERFILPNGLNQVSITSGGTVTSAGGNVFTGIKTDSILRYQKVGFNTETYNRISTVAADGLSMTVVGITSVSGVFDGSLPSSTIQPTVLLGAPIIRNQGAGSLYAQLPDVNISSVNLSDSLLTFSSQITGETTSASGVLTFDLSQITGITSAFFAPFDEERYSVHYSDGTIAPITSDQFVLNSNVVTISGLSNSKTNVTVNATLIKNGVQSKIKEYNRSQTLSVSLSKYSQSGSGISSSIGDGLTYNQYYGLRVQDEEISLNYPDVVKVISVYESFDSSAPTLDQVQFTSSANVTTNAVIGEDILGNTSKAIARVVSKPSTNVLGIVYLNPERFLAGETAVFKDSGITTEIESITPR